MQDLRVIGVENGALLVASDEGTRFRIPIDELMQSKLRQTIPDTNAGRKMSPREIQAQIRSGLSAQDVSNLTGVPLDYISRFEGPVLAEREFVVTSALNVSVHTALDADPFTQGMTFGSAIRHRLVALQATNERWASWKEEGSGWVVKLSFTAEQIDHDARWSFEPKKNTLAPLNNEAVALSQQGDAPSSLVPRLRAVSGNYSERSAASESVAESAAADSATAHQAAAQRNSRSAPGSAPGSAGSSSSSSSGETSPSVREPDQSRFDSGAFDLSRDDSDDSDDSELSTREAILSRFAPGNGAAHKGATERFDAAASSATSPTTTVSTHTAAANAGATNPTADLLEALRRRRGERESANYRDDDAFADDSATVTTPPAGIRLVEVPLEKYLANEPTTKATAPQPTTPAKSTRKGRTAMPSWDDIVFGARPDDLP